MAEMNSDNGQSKVHFNAEQVQQHDSQIVVTPDSETGYSVHLGFLQIHHSYEINFSFEDKLGEDLVSDPLQNLHVKVLTVQPREDGLGHEVTVHFEAYKEKLVKEQLVLLDASDKTQEVVLTFHARVLGKGKGTPALKTGIHCTGINREYDSEQSDWQGFD